jgi:hypothetical protein
MREDHLTRQEALGFEVRSESIGTVGGCIGLSENLDTFLEQLL